MHMRGGEVYFVDFDPVVGREQYGMRPALVVSIDRLNRAPLVVAVVPGTNAPNVRGDHPSKVLIPADETGFPLGTIFLCSQIRALDHSRFPEHPAGHLSTARMTDIEDAPPDRLG